MTEQKLEPSALAQRLLEAGRGERASRTTRRRAHGAAAHAFVLGASSTAVAQIGKAVGFGAVKWLGAGVIAGAVIGVAAVRFVPGDERAPEPALRAPKVLEHAAVRAPPAPLPAPEKPDIADAGRALDESEPERPIAEPRPRKIQPKSSAVVNSDELSLEVTILDRVRRALAADQNERALAELDQNAGRLKLLGPEAAVLRIEALTKSG